MIRKTKLLNYLYEFEHGKRITVDSRPGFESNTWVEVSNQKNIFHQLCTGFGHRPGNG
jgi:hypothetical protein